MSGVIDELLAHGKLLAVAYRYSDLYSVDAASAKQFACCLADDWFRALGHSGWDETPETRFLVLTVGLGLVVDGEALRQCPTAYMGGGQVRSDAREEAFHSLCAASRVITEPPLTFAEFDEMASEAARLELVTRDRCKN